MSDDCLRLFKPEDGNYGILEMSNNQNLTNTFIDIDTANSLLSERLSVGYVDSLNGSGVPRGITGGKFVCDTYRIHYLLIPLEDEEPECDHLYLRQFKLRYSDNIKENSSKQTSIDFGKCNYCPKCGQKLNET